MVKIDESLFNDRLRFTFHDRIDSSNSQEILNFLDEKIHTGDKVIFDFEDISYISSAGLRVVLKFARMAESFYVINVSSEVYSIFEMTGFCKIINVTKALRTISIEGKELIGKGYLGEVYRLDDDTIIKAFIRDTGYDDVEREIKLAKEAFIAGIPTAISFDVVKVKETGRFGLIFELLKSSCFNKLFIDHPEKEDENIQMYIDLLKKILSITVDDVSAFPDKRKEPTVWLDRLEKEKAFTNEEISQLRKLFSTIPASNHLVHGDYHIKNIMMQGDEPLLIDMDTLGVGHEIFEISAFYLTYIGYPSTDINNCPDFLGISDKTGKHIWNETFSQIYASRSEEEKKEILDKISLFGYTWLAYKTYIFEPNNLDRLNHSIGEVRRLLKTVKTLNY